ncbi:NEDD8 ultimate buster 1 [Operophtera brumata]|uniref:NEDD8 ultimate buster 1 n=1 Tax=Operophtera brumata TaxID=104452 RepID=A0A0L7LSG6_OPEBR|nr:NEDD8 ultimate buster 1 [Operophtera brumata]
METSLQHEDLLIKLRAKLNEDKIKLWEPPYIAPDNSVNQSLKELAAKYTSLGTDTESVLNALHELQLHSLDRSKANAEFKETGLATFRVKATVPGERPQVFNIQKKLDALGSEIETDLQWEGGEADPQSRGARTQERSSNHGSYYDCPEEARQEDTMYMEMRQTRDDATLLSECAGEAADDELEYMKPMNSQGEAVSSGAGLVAGSRPATQSLSSAGDAAARLARAERAFIASYGPDGERLVALKGNAALTQLMELGWSEGAARAGLRAAGGEPTRAHNYLADKEARRDLAAALAEMGHVRRKAALALRLTNNHAADAVRILQEQPELVQLPRPVPPPALEQRLRGNTRNLRITKEDSVMCSRRKERQEALGRLTAALGADEDAYLDTSLVEEESFLAQYKSLL